MYLEALSNRTKEISSFSAWSYFWFLLLVFLTGFFAWLYVRKTTTGLSGFRPVGESAAVRAEERLKSLDRSEVARQTTEIKEEFQSKRMTISSLFVTVKDMATCIDPGKIMELAMKCFRQGLEARRAVLLVREGDTEANPLFVASTLGYDDGELASISVPADEESVVGLAARTGALVSERELRESPTGDARVTTKGLLPSILACPLMAKGKIKGVIAVQEAAGEPDEAAERFGSTVASVAALALENAHAFEMTKLELLEERETSEAERQQKAMIKSMFQRYLAPEVVEELVKNPDISSMLRGKRREITVLFMDARGFTTYSETHTPEEVVSILNEYLSAMSDVITEHGGIVDKFVGDEIMALWGVPLEQEDHAWRAVRATYCMVEEMARLQNKWVEQGVEPLDIGFGINTGQAIVGNIGSEKRLDYTVIGDTVNLGARLEGLTRKHECYLIIGPRTKELVEEKIKVKSLGDVIVKGKNQGVEAFQVTAVQYPEGTGEWQSIREPYAIVTGIKSRQLIEQLEYGNAQEKKNALVAMGESDYRFYLPVLEKAMGIEPTGLRFFARRAYHQLRKTLETASPDVAEWVEEQDRFQWERLKKLLSSDNFRERIEAVLGFERVAKVSSADQCDEITGYYRALIERESHPFVLATVVRTLGTIGGPKCMPELARFLSHSDSRVVANAVEGLTAHPHKEYVPLVTPLAQSDDNRIRVNALKFLGRFGKVDVEVEARKIIDEDAENGLAESARYLLKKGKTTTL